MYVLKSKQEFIKGKWYRFVPTKTATFTSSIEELKYSPFFIWQLEISTKVFQAKKNGEYALIDGCVIKRNWCEKL